MQESSEAGRVWQSTHGTRRTVVSDVLVAAHVAQEELEHLELVVVDAHVEGRVAVRVGGRDVGAVALQVPRRLGLPQRRGEAQRELSVVAGLPRLEEAAEGAGVDVGARLDQELHHVGVLVHGGNVQRRLALVGTRGVVLALADLVGRADELGTVQADQIAHDGEAAGGVGEHRDVEDVLADGALGKDVLAGEELHDGVQVARLRGKPWRVRRLQENGLLLHRAAARTKVTSKFDQAGAPRVGMRPLTRRRSRYSAGPLPLGVCRQGPRQGRTAVHRVACCRYEWFRCSATHLARRACLASFSGALGATLGLRDIPVTVGSAGMKDEHMTFTMIPKRPRLASRGSPAAARGVHAGAAGALQPRCLLKRQRREHHPHNQEQTRQRMVQNAAPREHPT